ncbi:DUF4236 domain-containing protein [Mesorhizobium sp. WSM4935]|uniref:DUF4236 domain-containing protein n=1 Tax=Mesorhizobium sp. WSM4935 TaxID=3038547 RepID=UPI003FA5E7F3
MGFYVRKSVSAGPFLFNFSSGGVGVSVGVRRASDRNGSTRPLHSCGRWRSLLSGDARKGRREKRCSTAGASNTADTAATV